MNERTNLTRKRMAPKGLPLPSEGPTQGSPPVFVPGKMVSTPGRLNGRPVEHTLVDLTESARVAFMVTPNGRGPFREQAEEVLASMKAALAGRPGRMTITVQTIFLRDPQHRSECERIFQDYYEAERPVTNYVFQAPCGGAALALEAWAIGGAGVKIQRHGAAALSVAYDSVRWVYCAGIRPSPGISGVYNKTLDALEQTGAALSLAGSGYQHVVRTWFYLGSITGEDRGLQRYKELNRARTDFYQPISFCRSLLDPNAPRGVYPASTGIGMRGSDLIVGCVALQTKREDVFLFPLENPQQTPAYAYHPKYSPKSPKFSRAMALVLGDYVTTWISGTASIVDSESCHCRDIEKQTEQTIDNIERLIARENVAMHGVTGAGATLHDIAKVRVYIKRAKDFEQCREVCQKRFGNVPAIYAVADVCRPELLVEIEGVAFSRYTGLSKAGQQSAGVGLARH